MAVRAHPGGLPAAGGEIPLTRDAVAARHRDRLGRVRRSPGHHSTRISENRLHRLRREKRRDQRGAVGDEHVPTDRAIVAADLLDRLQIHPRRHLIAIDRARQQHATDARGMDLRQQWFGDALRALNFIRRSFDRRAEFSCTGNRTMGCGTDVVHATLAARPAASVNLRHAPTAAVP